MAQIQRRALPGQHAAPRSTLLWAWTQNQMAPTCAQEVSVETAMHQQVHNTSVSSSSTAFSEMFTRSLSEKVIPTDLPSLSLACCFLRRIIVTPGCNANQLCSERCGGKKTTSPTPGDAAVLGKMGSDGHVTIIMKIDDKNIHVMEQNYHISGARSMLQRLFHPCVPMQVPIRTLGAKLRVS